MDIKMVLAMMVVFLLLTSCLKKDEIINSSDVEIINSELLSEACVAEASQMSTVIFSGLSDPQLGSTLAAAAIPNFAAVDSLLTGAEVSVTGTGGKNNPQGTITIDFKSGTADAHGIIRKGKITITYSGRRWALGSTRTFSFSGYSRNNVIIGDTTKYKITSSTADSTATKRAFDHVLTSHALIFPDHTTFFISEAHFKDSTDFIAKTTTLLKSDLTSDVEGTTRSGAQFTIKIKSPLVYKPQCMASKMYLPNDGEKVITVGSSDYTIGYGSTCSRTVTVTVGDKPRMITVNSDGN